MAEALTSKRVRGISDAILALMVIAIVGIMIVPVPPAFLDIMLSFNIVFAIVILLVTMLHYEAAGAFSVPRYPVGCHRIQARSEHRQHTSHSRSGQCR